MIYYDDNIETKLISSTDKIMKESWDKISEIRKNQEETVIAWFLIILKDYYAEQDIEMFQTIIDIINKKIPVTSIKERLDEDGFIIIIKEPKKEIDWVSENMIKVYNNNYYIYKDGKELSNFNDYIKNINDNNLE